MKDQGGPEPEASRPGEPGCLHPSSFILHPFRDLQHSHAACLAITRRANSSFPLAFRVLPPAKRRAMTALYAFLRVTDDLADEPGDADAKRAALRDWREALDAALAGEPSHPVHPALVDAVRRFGVPVEHLLAVLDGVESDLQPVRFATFADLHPYLYRVASAVGLACLPIWGFRRGATAKDAHESAVAAGVAFQLTNVLRDLGEDLGNGRVYLPADELERFGCPPGAWRDPAHADAFRALMRFQVERARDYYRASEPLSGLLTADGRAIFGVMRRTYRGLLDAIEAKGYDVFTARVRTPKWRKAAALLGAWPTKWGWV